jgi:hypothetical protein
MGRVQFLPLLVGPTYPLLSVLCAGQNMIIYDSWCFWTNWKFGYVQFLIDSEARLITSSLTQGLPKQNCCPNRKFTNFSWIPNSLYGQSAPALTQLGAWSCEETWHLLLLTHNNYCTHCLQPLNRTHAVVDPFHREKVLRQSINLAFMTDCWRTVVLGAIFMALR